MDAYGIDKVCEDIAEGRSLRAIAEKAKSSLTRLLAWIEADPDRSARVRDARSSMARVWDDKAESEIREAKDEFELRKAKELAHHYRWRASKVAPKEYGDRITQEHVGDGGGPIKFEGLTDDQLDQRITVALLEVMATDPGFALDKK